MMSLYDFGYFVRVNKGAFLSLLTSTPLDDETTNRRIMSVAHFADIDGYAKESADAAEFVVSESDDGPRRRFKPLKLGRRWQRWLRRTIWIGGNALSAEGAGLAHD